jgi:DNA-binding FadR family transcriptional regulator
LFTEEEKNLKAEPLSKFIQDKIKAYIRDNALRPGDKLPTEAELAAELGASRTAVREALRGLETLGIIDVQKGSGRYLRKVAFSEVIADLAYNLEVSSANLADLLEIRMVLETQFVGEAVAALTEAEHGQLAAILEKMKGKMEAGRSFAEEDMAFHLTLFSKVDNQLFKDLLDTFWKLFITALPEELQLPTFRDTILQHHVDLLQAVQAKDIRRARELLQYHFTDVFERLH